MKEDEREVLAHIVQNIDEQEIFLEFVAKADTIKESWQIVKIFENKRKEFEQSLHEYNLQIKDKEKQLEILTSEIMDANNLLKDANKELDDINSRLRYIRSNANALDSDPLEKNQQIMMKYQDDDVIDVLNFNDIIGDFQPLSAVSVFVKSGSTAMARPAQSIYDDSLLVSYQKASSRLLKLKEYITELELANEKLTVELRDLFEEDSFKETLSFHEQIDSNDKYSNEKLENTISFNPSPKDINVNAISIASQVASLPQAKVQNSFTSSIHNRIDKQQLNNQYEHSTYDSTKTIPSVSNTRLDLDSLDLNQRAEKKKETVEQIFSRLNEILAESDVSTKTQESIKKALRDEK